MNTELIEQKLGAIENLPTIPLVLRQIQKIMQSPTSNMEQIAAVVAKDQALASRTIRLVNSAYYGLRNRVSSISSAIVILGLNSLNHLMIGLSVVTIWKSSKVLGFDAGKFWEHCFGVAIIAKELAQHAGVKESEQYFIAGLMHDMGRLVLEQFAHTDFTRAMITARVQKKPLLAMETGVIGFNHAEAGAWISRKWGLPEAISAPMEFHHHTSLPPSAESLKGIISIVSNANILCNQAQIGHSAENGYDLLQPGGIDKSIIQEVIEKARKEVKTTIMEWNKVL